MCRVYRRNINSFFLSFSRVSFSIERKNTNIEESEKGCTLHQKRKNKTGDDFFVCFSLSRRAHIKWRRENACVSHFRVRAKKKRKYERDFPFMTSICVRP